MSEQQSGRSNGQVRKMTAIIVENSFHLEAWNSRNRQFVIDHPTAALNLFKIAVRDRDLPPYNERQVAAIKYLINVSRDADAPLKKLFYILLDRSDSLTKEVYITLHVNEGFTDEFITKCVASVNDLCSSGGRTHLNELMMVTGTAFSFSCHYGHYNDDGEFDTTGMFAGLPGPHINDPPDMPQRCTFWLAKGHYGDTAGPPEEIIVTMEEIESVDLRKTGLYPELEKDEK